MANTIRIKRRTSGAAGAPSSLYNAELAFNEVDKVLYYGYGTGGAGGTSGSVIAIAGEGAFLPLAGAGTATLSKAVNFTGTVDFQGTTTALTVTANDNSTKVATTAWVRNQGYITSNQTINVYGDATGSGTTSITLTLANSGVTAGTYTKVTVNSKGLITSGTTLAASDIPTLTASKISDFDTQVRTSRLDQMAAPSSSLSLNSQKITSLADPTNAQDAATKNYVDSVAQGLDVKASVKVATTANITLSGTQTIDGITVSAGDRVLVKNQSTASQNGIYVASASAWSRSSDMDVWAELVSAFTFVEQGTTQADTGWVCTVDAGGTLGTTAIAFSQFSGAGAYSAGNGLSLTGNTFSVQANGTSLDVSASGVRINPSYVGQTSITTLGTVTVGTWNGGVIGGTYGGTGVNNGSYTITLGGNISTAGTFSTSGAFGVTLTATGLTNVTLPTSGTLVNTAVTALTSLASVGTLTSGTWNATTIGVPYGGTGVTTLTGLVKGNGTSAFSAAIAGTDYLDPNSTLDCGTF